MMAHPLWVIRFIMKSFPNRFAIARLSRIPGMGAIIERFFFENDDIIYLPKDKIIDLDKSFDITPSTVLPSQVVEHFINKSNYHWIMNWCICRKSTGCKDYPTTLGCLFLGEATIKIDKRLGRSVTKKEALEHIRRCREAGLVQLIGRNRLDAVWLDVKPTDRLMTICNCCPCCCLWRMLPQLSPRIGSKVTKMPGVEVAVVGNCVGCGSCSRICFVSAIKMVDNRAFINNECRGCGRCVEICPQKAIAITFDGSLSIEKSISRISTAVRVE